MKNIFYGWIILPAAIIGTLASVPGQTVGISVFTDFLLHVHDISRSGISFAYLVGTVCSALFLSWAGRLYDRFGARVIGVPVALGLAGTLVLLSCSDAVANAIAASGYIQAPLASFLVLSLSFFFVRFLGQGNMTMICRNMVMKWFDKKRGLANAFLGVSISLGFSAAPGILDRFIRSAGWRETWRGMAIFLAVLSFFIFLIFRDNPESMGQKADGKMSGKSKTKRTHLGPLKRLPSLPETDFLLSEARRSPVFWIIALSLGMSALLVTAVTFHIVSIFEVSGVQRSAAVVLFLPASIVAVVCQFIGSAVSDYISERILCAVHLFGGLLLALTVIGTDGLQMKIFFIAGLGLCQGMMGINAAILFPRVFGLSSLGAISGFSMALGVTGSAIGPFLFSLSLDLFSSYRAAGLLFLLVQSALLLFTLLKRDLHPRHRS